MTAKTVEMALKSPRPIHLIRAREEGIELVQNANRKPIAHARVNHSESQFWSDDQRFIHSWSPFAK